MVLLLRPRPGGHRQRLRVGGLLTIVAEVAGRAQSVPVRANQRVERGQRLRAYGIQARPRLAFGDPEQEILRAALEIGAELIVISHRRRGG